MFLDGRSIASKFLYPLSLIIVRTIPSSLPVLEAIETSNTLLIAPQQNQFDSHFTKISGTSSLSSHLLAKAYKLSIETITESD